MGQVILCDTNILIEFYKENQSIINSLKSIGQENIAVSVIVSAELIYGALNKKELMAIKKDLYHLKEIHIDNSIGHTFIELLTKYSLSHNLMIADALIAATAIVHDLPLYTLNKKDFLFMVCDSGKSNTKNTTTAPNKCVYSALSILALMTLFQQIIDRLDWTKSRNRHLDKQSHPICHSTIPKTW